MLYDASYLALVLIKASIAWVSMSGFSYSLNAESWINPRNRKLSAPTVSPTYLKWIKD